MENLYGVITITVIDLTRLRFKHLNGNRRIINLCSMDKSVMKIIKYNKFTFLSVTILDKLMMKSGNFWSIRCMRRSDLMCASITALNWISANLLLFWFVFSDKTNYCLNKNRESFQSFGTTFKQLVPHSKCVFQTIR